MPRTPLSRERVLTAAIDLADARGIEALSMRKLAQELGVEAMSLYHHVANKDEILNGIVDLVVDEIEPPCQGRRVAGGDQAQRDLGARRLPATSLGVQPRPDDVGDQSGAAAVHGRAPGEPARRGLPAELTYHGYHALDSHIMGFTLWQGNFPATEELAETLPADFLRDFPTDRYPDLAEHIGQHAGGSGHDGGSDFEFVLDLILDGLERLRDPPAPQG